VNQHVNRTIFLSCFSGFYWLALNKLSCIKITLGYIMKKSGSSKSIWQHFGFANKEKQVVKRHTRIIRFESLEKRELLTTLHWVGAVSDNSWNSTSTNWKTDQGNPSTFADGDDAVFDNTSANKSVLISGTVKPKSITFAVDGYNIQNGNISAPGTNTSIAITVNPTFTESISSVITDNTGNVSLTKNGTGTLQLNSANTYSGGTTINAGKLKAGINDALKPNTAVSIVSPGSLDVSNYITIGSLSGNGGIVIQPGLILNVDGGAFSGVISGSSGNLTKTTSTNTPHS
jgi:autotransporter-associated beta strand protein